MVSIVLFTENKLNVRRGRLHGGSGLPTVWEPFLTGFMRWLELELRVGSALRRLCFVYIYNALQHFNIIYKTKGNRRINRLRQSMHFFHMNTRNPLRPFSNGHILECLLCIGTVPRPVVTFLVTSLIICVYVHATTILTL